MRPALEAAIERNIAAGVLGPELDVALAVLDEMDGDSDFESPDDEPDDLEDGCPDNIPLLCVCTCGHRHSLGTWPDIERIDVA